MKIIVDTREQQPWDFSIFGYEMVRATVNTGDYTIEGHEKLIAIERKKSTGELALNLGKKSKQFEAEMERMLQYRFRYIICEFPSERFIEFPKGSTIPPKLWPKVRMNGKFMFSKLMRWCEHYGVEAIFCNNRGEAEAEAARLIGEAIKVIDEEKENSN